MIFSRKRCRTLLVLTLATLSLCSCKKFEGDTTIPSYIHLDRIDVVPQRQNAPSAEAGFYTSLVDAVQFIAYFEGDDAETTLGTFQLPCTIPVLRSGKMKYLHVYPVVKQNGMAATRIYYSFYDYITLNGIRLAADSTTCLGSYDAATNEWYLQTNYKTRDYMTVLCEDYFEPTTFSSNLDSNVVWVSDDPEGACTGQGYGLVHVADSVDISTFYFTPEFSDLTAGHIVYLEMDYQTDLELYLGMVGFETSGGSASTKSIMALVPNDHWQKIYINVTRTWSQFNYNTPFTLFFQAVNEDGTGGDIRLDNVKLLTLK